MKLSACFRVSLFAVGIMAIFFCCRHSRAKDGSRIYYINSYHKGYPASDKIMEALQKAFSKHTIDLKIFFLDTKNNPQTSVVERKTKQVLEDIRQFKPGVIIVSDDAAVKYVVVPYLKNAGVPIVFCGVNWSADAYQLPATTVTGMLEVLPLRENLRLMKTYFPDAKKLTVLSERSISEEKNTQLLDTLYRNMGFTVQYELVESYSEWKTKFITANEQSDIIYLPTNGAIKGWDSSEAKQFVKTHITKPVVTCDDFMMPYCVYGLTKVAEEQGSWAGNAALQILSGKSPADIPITKNKETRSYINNELASKIGLSIKF
jgi:ABC-type uncharacterized transport system substrate-binding protein